jgi:hypothetical protein
VSKRRCIHELIHKPCERRRRGTRRNYSNLSANQFGRQRRQAIGRRGCANSGILRVVSGAVGDVRNPAKKSEQQNEGGIMKRLTARNQPSAFLA